MARKELATTAAELLVINRPTARDLDVVERRFRLHPLDLEALFSVPTKSSAQSYGSYIRISLSWPELVNGRVGLADAVFLVSADALAIISHHASPVLEAVIRVWQSEAKNDQRSAVAVLIESLAVIARSVEKAVAATDVPATEIETISSAITVLATQADKLSLGLTPELAPRLSVIQHRLKYASETLATTKQSIRAQGAHPRLNHLVRGYALASAAVILLVLVTVTR